MLQPRDRARGAVDALHRQRRRERAVLRHGEFLQDRTPPRRSHRSDSTARCRRRAPRTLASATTSILPVYVCSQGVGTFNAVGYRMHAANGTLNPYNPFAARWPDARSSCSVHRMAEQSTPARARFARLSASTEASPKTGATRPSSRPPRSACVGSRATTRSRSGSGTWPPAALSISPIRMRTPRRSGTTSHRSAASTTRRGCGRCRARSRRTWWTCRAARCRPRSARRIARSRSIRPSANPANDVLALHRYYSINAVGTAGSRDVKSAFFELDAPVLKQLELVASGRFDDYSTGQSNFSPKFGFKFTPDRADCPPRHLLEGFPHPELQRSLRSADHGLTSHAPRDELPRRRLCRRIARRTATMPMRPTAYSAGAHADRQPGSGPGKVDVVHRRPGDRASESRESQLHARLLEHRGEEPDHRASPTRRPSKRRTTRTTAS